MVALEKSNVALHRVEFRLLGPLEVVVDGGNVEIGSRKQRMLLCALAAEPGRAVPADTLVEVLWAGAPPNSAAVTLRGLISRLRRTLGAVGDRLVASRGGYLLRLTADEVDADRFVRLLARGRDDLAIGRPDQAVAALRTALGMWRTTVRLPLEEMGESAVRIGIEGQGISTSTVPGEVVLRDSTRLGDRRPA